MYAHVCVHVCIYTHINYVSKKHHNLVHYFSWCHFHQSIFNCKMVKSVFSFSIFIPISPKSCMSVHC